MQRPLPHQTDSTYLVYAGTGTDLIFNHGLDLPGFASFPLLETPDTRVVLAGQMQAFVDLADQMEMGCILDAPNWMANADRAKPLGYGAGRLDAVNRDGVALMEEVRQGAARDDVLVSACVGPRFDPYADVPLMDPDAARTYHSAQIGVLKDTSVDLATAYTFNRPSEAIGCIRAAQDHDLPIIMSLVVETDGCLADGTRLTDAIDNIDRETRQGAAYFMLNCAHPSHFDTALHAHPRLKGVVVNASKCSHAELDEADTLDDGDPVELGQDTSRLKEDNPALQVFGGCCGTDMRHMEQIARKVRIQ